MTKCVYVMHAGDPENLRESGGKGPTEVMV